MLPAEITRYGPRQVRWQESQSMDSAAIRSYGPSGNHKVCASEVVARPHHSNSTVGGSSGAASNSLLVRGF